MSSMTVRQDVAASPERLCRVITDLDGTAEVVSDIRGVKRLDGGDGLGVGRRWLETRVMLGREAWGSIRKALAQDLQDIATAAERGK